MLVNIGKYRKTNPPLIKVRIDEWDTWNMDYTLACIIHPMLKQLKATNHGYPMIDDSDGLDFENRGVVDEHRWTEILNEMIWAFEQILDEDSDDGFYEDGVFDSINYTKHHNRIKRGTTLFGKYYGNLWD